VLSTDGFNALGDANGRAYNRLNYSDSTIPHYVPTNLPIPSIMVNPDRWQTNIAEIFTNCSSIQNRFYPRTQTFMTPQARNVHNQLISPEYVKKKLNTLWRGPTDTWAKNKQAYIAKTNQVLDTLASLTDAEKIQAEWFDNKLLSLGTIGSAAAEVYLPGADFFDQYFIFQFLVNEAIWTAVTIAWEAKNIFNAVRPYSSIRWINLKKPVNYDNPQYYNVTSYAGPFQGTRNFPADNWESYLTTEPHPEYPSGTTCVCHSWAASAALFFGTDVLDFSYTFPAGSSYYEPGVTPHSPVTVFFPTFTEMANTCGLSRNWAGVHFLASIEESARVCPNIAEPAYKNLQKLLKGDISWKYW